jgi:dsDNA-specific endonuclease/ATPase MutS2
MLILPNVPDRDTIITKMYGRLVDTNTIDPNERKMGIGDAKQAVRKDFLVDLIGFLVEAAIEREQDLVDELTERYAPVVEAHGKGSGVQFYLEALDKYLREIL